MNLPESVEPKMNSESNIDTPVLFLVFNRPEVALRVFREIRKARPPRLYIASDGPRETVPHEQELVDQTRKEVLDAIDWKCDVHTLFREINLGCKIAVGEAITWFFEHEEMGIILEDDCLPDQSFFPFCEELLRHYKDDTRVGQICGLKRFGTIQASMEESYFFTRYASIWGWASWRRAWKYYKDEISNKVAKTFEHDQIPEQITFTKRQLIKRKRLIETLRENQIDTWDYFWGVSRFSQSMLSIIPTKNLIENIGFGSDATHTTQQTRKNIFTRQSMEFPIKHRTEVVSHLKYDQVFAEMIIHPTLMERMIYKFQNLTGLRIF